MAERPSADRTAELLFWYARKPSRYQAEGRRRDAPRLDPEVILRLALGRSVKFADASWNEPAKIDALGKASRAYVRNLFFRPDPTPYEVLGLEPGASPAAIKECFRLLMQLVHPDRQGEKKRWPDACAAQANWAYSMLRDQEARRTFEEEAEARAALQRAINRAAMAAEASQMPTVVWPKKSAKERFAIPGQMLPEWLTAGVGGFVRHNPATVAFGSLITISALVIAASLWEGRDGSLIRVAREEQSPPASVVPATMPAAEGAAVAAPLPADPIPARNPRPAAERPIVLASASSGMGMGHAAADVTPQPGILEAASGARQLQDPTPTALPSPPTSPAPSSAISATPISEVPAAPQAAPPQSTPAPPQAAPLSVAIAAPAPALAMAVPAASAPAAVPPADKEVEALLANFVDAYERGRVDAFAALFDDDADTNLRRGRAAIRGEYDELFRLSQWRRMQLTRISWRPVGDRAVAKGELTVKIGWRDGRQVEQRVNVDMEFVRRDGRVLIAKLSHQPKNP